MTDLDRVVEIRQRLEAATPGPWYQGREDRQHETSQDVFSKENTEDEDTHDIATYVWSPEDASLIASAPVDLAWACDTIEQLRAERDKIIQAVRDVHQDGGYSQGYFPGDRGYSTRDHCCTICGTHGEYGVEWPCATIRTLDGEA